VKITYDPRKREATLEARGLDFADADLVFEEQHFTRRDDRYPYGEDRFVSVGQLSSRVVVMVWTPRGNSRRVISMRDANAKEKKLYRSAIRGSR
jgi:uncharacterized DUF497 family protein